MRDEKKREQEAKSQASRDQRYALCAMLFAQNRERVKWIAAGIAYIAMIFVLARLPGGAMPQLHRVPHHFLELLQNALHIPLYAGLAWLLLRAARAQNSNLSTRQVGVIVAVTVSIALADEFIQSFSPGRTASLLDVGLDLLGVLAVAVPMRMRQ